MRINLKYFWAVSILIHFSLTTAARSDAPKFKVVLENKGGRALDDVLGQIKELLDYNAPRLAGGKSQNIEYIEKRDWTFCWDSPADCRDLKGAEIIFHFTISGSSEICQISLFAHKLTGAKAKYPLSDSYIFPTELEEFIMIAVQEMNSLLLSIPKVPIYLIQTNENLSCLNYLHSIRALLAHPILHKNYYVLLSSKIKERNILLNHNHDKGFVLNCAIKTHAIPHLTGKFVCQGGMDDFDAIIKAFCQKIIYAIKNNQ